jgi:type I restriction enzyme M protein
VEENADQFLRPYDIVLIIKGSVGKVGIVTTDVPEPQVPGGWVAGQSAIVLRAKQDVFDPSRHRSATEL